MKTYEFHFEGTLEIEADSIEEARDRFWELVSKEDISYTEAVSSDEDECMDKQYY